MSINEFRPRHMVRGMERDNGASAKNAGHHKASHPAVHGNCGRSLSVEFSNRAALPTALTEPLCFCHVDGCFQIGAGGANMAVGDGAAWCRPKAPFVSPDTLPLRPQERDPA